MKNTVQVSLVFCNVLAVSEILTINIIIDDDFKINTTRLFVNVTMGAIQPSAAMSVEKLSIFD